MDINLSISKLLELWAVLRDHGSLVEAKVSNVLTTLDPNLNLRWIEVCGEDGGQAVDGNLDCLVLVVIFLLLELFLQE